MAFRPWLRIFESCVHWFDVGRHDAHRSSRIDAATWHADLTESSVEPTHRRSHSPEPSGSGILFDVIPRNEARRDDRADNGTWLPLADIVQERDTLRRIVCRLVGNGKVQSRESARGEVEIWISDDDRLREAPSPHPDVIGPAQSPVPAEYGPSAVGQQLAVLISPLASSYERNVQLARENGTLTERVAILERDLKALRDSAAADKRALDLATERLRIVEAAEAERPRRSATRHAGHDAGAHWAWRLLAIGALLGLAAVAVWYVGPPF